MELINKANIWSSSVKWRKIGSFDEGDGYFRIVKRWEDWVLPENQVRVKALTNTLEGVVIEEDLNNDDTRHCNRFCGHGVKLLEAIKSYMTEKKYRPIEK